MPARLRFKKARIKKKKRAGKYCRYISPYHVRPQPSHHNSSIPQLKSKFHNASLSMYSW